ncbi:MAG TPA: amidohydrolase family protein [Vicinamibacterales bacterium]
MPGKRLWRGIADENRSTDRCLDAEHIAAGVWPLVALLGAAHSLFGATLSWRVDFPDPTATGHRDSDCVFHRDFEISRTTQELIHELGMTPAQAIIAGTKRPAEAFGLNDVGSLEAGKAADFLVLDANPLDDIRNMRKISKVYLRGSELDRAALRATWTQ